MGTSEDIVIVALGESKIIVIVPMSLSWKWWRKHSSTSEDVVIIPLGKSEVIVIVVFSKSEEIEIVFGKFENIVTIALGTAKDISIFGFPERVQNIVLRRGWVYNVVSRVSNTT